MPLRKRAYKANRNCITFCHLALSLFRGRGYIHFSGKEKVMDKQKLTKDKDDLNLGNQKVMSKPAYYMVNGITIYRIVAVVAFIVLIGCHQWNVFRWLLLLSFLTDVVDGFLARWYSVISKAGAVLDSIGDDLTVAVAIAGLLVFDPTFLRRELVIVVVLASLYLVQTITSLVS